MEVKTKWKEIKLYIFKNTIYTLQSPEAHVEKGVKSWCTYILTMLAILEEAIVALYFIGLWVLLIFHLWDHIDISNTNWYLNFHAYALDNACLYIFHVQCTFVFYIRSLFLSATHPPHTLIEKSHRCCI